MSAYCQRAGDTKGAIEFLLLAKQTDQAFLLATESSEMDLYVQALSVARGGDVPVDEYLRVARFFEDKSNWGEAGRFYAKAGQHHKALRFFLQCGEERLNDAVEVVGKARNEMLTHTLIDFLMGETDGMPKDPNFIFKLYMSLGNYAQAAKTAVIIAKQEQDIGNYRGARTVLFDTYKELAGRGVRVPTELTRLLELVHSYIIVKKLVKLNDHVNAAHMLLRVARNISKFPAHTVPILTSVVVECQRAGMKESAFEYATTLMRPEYRMLVDEKLRPKIEGLVRRPQKGEAEEELTPCPACETKLPATTLDCPSCKNHLPYCIISGRHMVLDDWSECPHCRWPALFSSMGAYVKVENEGGESAACPMCDQVIVASALQVSRDPAGALKKLLSQGAKEEEDGPKGSPTAASAAGGGGGGGGSTPSASGGSKSPSGLTSAGIGGGGGGGSGSTPGGAAGGGGTPTGAAAAASRALGGAGGEDGGSFGASAPRREPRVGGAAAAAAAALGLG